MAMVGRGNRAIETLPAELRAAVDAALDVGGGPTTVYEAHGLQPFMDVRTFQLYAVERRRERQVQIAADARALLDALLEMAEVDRTTLSAVQRLTLGTVLREMMTSGKGTTRLNAVKAILDIQENQRRQGEHESRMRVERVKAELDAKAKPDAGGQRVVSMEEVARILEGVDLGRTEPQRAQRTAR